MSKVETGAEVDLDKLDQEDLEMIIKIPGLPIDIREEAAMLHMIREENFYFEGERDSKEWVVPTSTRTLQEIKERIGSE